MSVAVNIYQVETPTTTLFTQDYKTLTSVKPSVYRVVAKFRVRFKDKAIFNPIIQNSYFLKQKAPHS